MTPGDYGRGEAAFLGPTFRSRLVRCVLIAMAKLAPSRSRSFRLVSGLALSEDPARIGVVRSGGFSGTLPSQPHRRDAVPQDLELDVEPKFTTELGVDLQRLSVFSAGAHADHREHRPDDMMLGPVQVLFEGAPSDSERKTHLFRRRLPRELVVAGFAPS